MWDLGIRKLGQLPYSNHMFKSKHIQYLLDLDKKQSDLFSVFTQHLRLNGIYWATTCLALLGALDQFDKNEIIKQVLSCSHPNGGFGGFENHGSSFLSLSFFRFSFAFHSFRTSNYGNF
jgi:prenyltransferase beta subunit